MNAAALLAELSAAGIRLSRSGDRLRVEARPGTLTTELREQLTASKPDLLVLLDDTTIIRDQLLTLASAEGLSPAIVERLFVDDLAACRGLTDATLRAFLRALHKSALMTAGVVPPTFTVAARCHQCGPVWLSEAPPPEAKSCPWCFRRRAGMSIPVPPERQVSAAAGDPVPPSPPPSWP